MIIIQSLDALKSIRETEKNPKTLSSGQKNPKKPKKTPKTQKKPKKPTGLGFFKKNRVFSNPVIRRPLLLTNGSGSDSGSGSGSCYFRQCPSRWQLKKKFQSCFAYCLLFVATFTSFLKRKGIKKSQNSRNQGFLFLHDDRRIRVRTSY